jgi:hypothetical protein
MSHHRCKKEKKSRGCGSSPGFLIFLVLILLVLGFADGPGLLGASAETEKV